MQLIIPSEITSKLIDALTQTGQREIGGILMGEHVGPDTFRVKELTIQRKGGAFSAFTRIVSEFLAPLWAFFEMTRHDYARFNYLGEWHSHHSFALSPSRRDHMTMYDIMMEPQFGARFTVLLLVKIDNRGLLQAGVTVYQQHLAPFAGAVLQEPPRLGIGVGS